MGACCTAVVVAAHSWREVAQHTRRRRRNLPLVRILVEGMMEALERMTVEDSRLLGAVLHRSLAGQGRRTFCGECKRGREGATEAQPRGYSAGVLPGDAKSKFKDGARTALEVDGSGEVGRSQRYVLDCTSNKEAGEPRPRGVDLVCGGSSSWLFDRSVNRSAQRAN